MFKWDWKHLATGLVCGVCFHIGSNWWQTLGLIGLYVFGIFVGVLHAVDNAAKRQREEAVASQPLRVNDAIIDVVLIRDN